jgi:polyketide synthase-associated protein
MTEHKFEFQTVEIHGLDGPVKPLETDDSPTEPTDVNGQFGQAVAWSDEKGLYWVKTFGGLIVPVPEENLKEYEIPKPPEGGFDLIWPFHQETFFEFSMQVCNEIVSKGYCVMQMCRTEESRKAAARKAARLDYTCPKEEFVTDYLGLKGSGKVTEFDPLKLQSVQDVQDESLDDLPEDMLTKYDLDISSLFGVMGPMTKDTMGFNSCGRTEKQVWMSFGASREAATMQPEPLTEEDIEEGLVEKHLRFIRRRKLCFLYMINNAGGKLTLYGYTGEPVELPVEAGRLVVFRCDAMQYKYQPEGSHLTLQAWVLEDAPKYEVKDVQIPDICRDEAFGVLAGPKVPTGELSRVMSIGVKAGGGQYSLAQCVSMYLSAVDGHTRVANSRFDTDIYLTKDGDNDLRPYQNSYHHHGRRLRN